MVPLPYSPDQYRWMTANLCNQSKKYPIFTMLKGRCNCTCLFFVLSLITGLHYTCLMIYIRSPYSFEKNLGAAYNKEMELLPNDDDWAILMDTDTLFLDVEQPRLFQKAIEANPNAGIYTCYASRTGMRKQQFENNKYTLSADLKLHRQIAIDQLKKPFSVIPIKGEIAGYCFAIKKSTWKSVGRFSEKGILSVDTDFSKRLIQNNLQIFLIENIYILHYYRLLEGYQNKSHLL